MSSAPLWLCSMQTRAPLNMSMCAQQTSAWWKGFCKAPVRSAFAPRFCVEIEHELPGPRFHFECRCIDCCEMINKVISPLDSFDLPGEKGPQSLPRGPRLTNDVHERWMLLGHLLPGEAFIVSEKHSVSARSQCQGGSWNILSLAAGFCKVLWNIDRNLETSHKIEWRAGNTSQVVMWTCESQQLHSSDQLAKLFLLNCLWAKHITSSCFSGSARCSLVGDRFCFVAQCVSLSLMVLSCQMEFTVNSHLRFVKKLCVQDGKLSQTNNLNNYHSQLLYVAIRIECNCIDPILKGAFQKNTVEC